MDETIEQKVIRNVQGQFAVYKTPAVVGEKNLIANVEWEDSEDIDKFFMFAKNLNAKVIYISEGEEEDEVTGESKNTILQIGFLHEGIMHHVNFIDDEDEEEDGEEEYEEEVEYVDEDEEEPVQAQPSPNPVSQQQPNQNPNSVNSSQPPVGDQFISGGMNQQQQSPNPYQPQNNQGFTQNQPNNF